MADEFCLKNARLPRNIQRSFTYRKSTTWDRRLYFPSERRRAEDFFFALKKSDGFDRVRTPQTWVPNASTLPLDHRSRLFDIFIYIFIFVFISVFHSFLSLSVFPVFVCFYSLFSSLLIWSSFFSVFSLRSYIHSATHFFIHIFSIHILQKTMKIKQEVNYM